MFEVFLPQLLLYPNPSDPLNGDAASLMMKDRKQYDQKVKGGSLITFQSISFSFAIFDLSLTKSWSHMLQRMVSGG